MSEREEEKIEVLLHEGRAAEILTVKTKTLQAWRVRGEGPRFVKLGRCVRYRFSDLEEFIARQTRRSTSDPGKKLEGMQA